MQYDLNQNIKVLKILGGVVKSAAGIVDGIMWHYVDQNQRVAVSDAVWRRIERIDTDVDNVTFAVCDAIETNVKKDKCIIVPKQSKTSW